MDRITGFLVELRLRQTDARTKGERTTKLYGYGSRLVETAQVLGESQCYVNKELSVTSKQPKNKNPQHRGGLMVAKNANQPGANRNSSLGSSVVDKLDLIARLTAVQITHRDFSELIQVEQIKVLSKHGLKNKEISSLLGVKPPNVSAALKK